MADYGPDHKHTRKWWQPHVATGTIRCRRYSTDPQCPGLITPGQPWDLGHPDHPGQPSHPEHVACNRRAGAIKGNRHTSTGYTWP